MYLILTKEDLTKLKASTRADLMAHFLSEPMDAERFPRGTEDYNWNDRVDLTLEQVKEFMVGLSDETVTGLKIIAEEGPDIAANLLERAGIDNYANFQGRTTKRVRTITGNKNAYLLAWDDWGSEDNQQYGCGHYAVTSVTHRSLMDYFGF